MRSPESAQKFSANLRSAVFSISVDPLSVSQNSTIRASFKAKSVTADPQIYSSLSCGEGPGQLRNVSRRITNGHSYSSFCLVTFSLLLLLWFPKTFQYWSNRVKLVWGIPYYKKRNITKHFKTRTKSTRNNINANCSNSNVYMFLLTQISVWNTFTLVFYA